MTGLGRSTGRKRPDGRDRAPEPGQDRVPFKNRCNVLFFRVFTTRDLYLSRVIWLKRHRWLIAILVVSTVVRVAMAHDRDRWPLTTDEADRERQGLVYATHCLGVEDAASYRAPEYPLLIAMIYAVAGTETVYVRYLQAFVSALVALLVYHLARRLRDARVPVLAALVAAFYPLWLLRSVSLLPDALVALLVVAICLQATRMSEDSTVGRALILGGMAGVAALSGLVLLVWIPFVTCLVILNPTRGRIGDALNRLAALACGLLVVLVPWMIRNETVTGYRLLVPNDTSLQLLIGHEPRARGTRDVRRDYVRMYERMTMDEGDPVQKERRVSAAVWRWVSDAPGRSAELGLRKMWSLWNSVVPDVSRRIRLGHFLSGFAVTAFGLAGICRYRRERVSQVVASVLLVWTVYTIVFYTSPEGRVPTDLCLIPLSAAMALCFYDHAREVVARRLRELEAA